MRSEGLVMPPFDSSSATRPRPGDGTLECARHEPNANWFGASMEPQEEFINAGTRAEDLIETGLFEALEPRAPIVSAPQKKNAEPGVRDESRRESTIEL